MTNFADKCHHAKEEELLFPALENVGIPVAGGPIGVMLAEHAQGRAHISAMKEALSRHPNNDTSTLQLFAVAGLAYVKLLREHINKENTVLFVMAEKLLSADEHARLSAGFEKIELERIGKGMHEQFHALIYQLHDIYL